MPLRDHFRPPIWSKSSWEGFHAMWPTPIVLELNKQLPEQFTAEPRVHLGSYCEIDVCAFSGEHVSRSEFIATDESDGGVATAAWAPPTPTLVAETDFPDEYAYEVLVFDQDRGRVLVAAIEIVSPANKDRRNSRRAFVTKCAALLQQDVCVSIVDLVTVRHFNLYAELLAEFDQTEPAFGAAVPHIYAGTCRFLKVHQHKRFESWAYPLAVGRPLPSLPIWLSPEFGLSLDLEPSYEATCRGLKLDR
jgi:hypothetical protein